MTKLLFLLLLLTSFSFEVFAQKVEEPEDCILRVMQGAAKDNAWIIRNTCIRRYLKAVEPKAVSVALNLTSSASAYWTPRTTSGYNQFGNEPTIRIGLKNNSMYRLVFVVVHLIDKESQVYDTYKIYADSPIEPFSSGEFNSIVKTGDRIVTGDEFWNKYTWSIQFVGGVTR